MSDVIQHSSSSVEWYTRPAVIELARTVLGQIDLDPASCGLANGVVRATRFYAREDDGLSQHWAGKVWMNPPYTDHLDQGDGTTKKVNVVAHWVSKLLDEWDSGRLEGAVALVRSSTETRWFHRLLNFPFCLPRTRLDFWQQHPNEDSQPGHPSALFYLGDDWQLFANTFQTLGPVFCPLDFQGQLRLGVRLPLGAVPDWPPSLI